MKKFVNDGGPAFPIDDALDGLTKRDFFAIFAPKPSKGMIKTIMEHEQMKNPHGDSYKPKRRSGLEIECALRYRYADVMLKARNEEEE